MRSATFYGLDCDANGHSPTVEAQECQSLILTQALRATISDISAQPDTADGGSGGSVDSALAQCVTAI